MDNQRSILSVLVICVIAGAAFCELAIAEIDDPTRPPYLGVSTTHVTHSAKRSPRWVLKSTLVSAGRRTAIINDQVVSKGDHINGATVVDIQSSKVRLRDKNRDITLVMLNRNVKTPSRQPIR